MILDGRVLEDYRNDEYDGGHTSKKGQTHSLAVCAGKFSAWADWPRIEQGHSCPAYSKRPMTFRHREADSGTRTGSQAPPHVCNFIPLSMGSNFFLSRTKKERLLCEKLPKGPINLPIGLATVN